MPLDDRLRAALQEIADEIDPDVDRRMRRILATPSHSRMRRATAALAYAAAFGLAIAVVAAPSILNRLGSAGSAAASPTACGDADLRVCAGPLEPGAHRSQLFIPPIDFIIPVDSSVAWDSPEDRPGTYTLHPAGPETDAIFFFRDVRVLTRGCNPVFDDNVGNTATEIAAWLTANSGITATPAEPVRISGLRGVLVDIAVSGTYTMVCPNDELSYPEGLPILPLFAGSGAGEVTWFIGGDERIRLYVLDMPGGGNVVIGIDAIGGDFDALLEVSQPVIDSIVFDEDYY
jgi:hypothetical protein